MIIAFSSTPLRYNKTNTDGYSDYDYFDALIYYENNYFNNNTQLNRIHLQGFSVIFFFYFISMDFYKVHSFFLFLIFNIERVLQGAFI